MNNVDVVLKSGAKLHMASPPFEDALGLLEACSKATKGAFNNEAAGSAIMTDPEAKAAIRKIMPRCTYEDMRLTPDLFDDPKHTDRLRNDYLEICAKIVEVTCGPFLELTSSALSGNGAIPPVAPRS